MSKTIRVGAIGAGYWGPNLIRNFIELPNSQLIGVADLDQKLLDRIGTRFPQIETTTTNYRELFDLNLDAVVIATPPQTHFTLAKDCMENGLHVLVEKPLTLNSDESKKLIEIAEEHNKVLMVGHVFEYNTGVLALKDLMDSGELGEIYYIDFVRASLGLFQTKANVLWDLAPHDISILRYLLGEDPITISSTGMSCLNNGIEDVAYTTFTFPNRVLAHIRSSWLDPSKTRSVTVVGSKKMVVYDDIEPIEKIKIYDKGVEVIRRTDTFGDFSFAYHYGDMIAPYYRFEEPLREECRHFLHCIETGEAPRSDGENGLRVVQILEAADYSLKHNGLRVSMDFETNEIAAAD
ncbi:MAG: Gfo/Idh/MocA family oxidoreductase [Chloroflexota bacterium]